jgi:parvulin-like peptidyl-prolyl isomerase
MTRRELTRWQKQQRQERLALFFVIATIASIVLILGFGIWREILSRPGQVVARVGATNITLGALADETKYRAKTLDRQIELTDLQVRQAKAQAQSDPTSSFLVQYLEQQLQQLQLERLQMGYGQTLMEEMIERELIRQEVLKRGAHVTAADIEAEIQLEFQPTAPSLDALTDTEPITDTAATPTPVPTPIPADAWKASYQETLTTYNLTDAEFRRFTMEPTVWRKKLQDILGATVPTSAEQVKARHILVATEVEANDILALLNGTPPASFEDLAAASSTDTTTRDQGGDLGWFPRGVMTPAFEEAVFAMQPGQVSGVIATTFGFHIIKLEERDANRPLTADQISQAKTTAYNNWLGEAQQTTSIQRFFDSDKQTWLNKQIPEFLY